MTPYSIYRFYVSFLKLLRDLEDKYKKENMDLDEKIVEELDEFLCDRLDIVWWKLTEEDQDKINKELESWG